MTMKVNSGESRSNLGVVIASVALKARRIRDVLLRDMYVSLEMHWTSRRAVNYAASAMMTNDSLGPILYRLSGCDCQTTPNNKLHKYGPDISYSLLRGRPASNEGKSLTNPAKPSLDTRGVDTWCFSISNSSMIACR